jgi:hypothetical protein
MMEGGGWMDGAFLDGRARCFVRRPRQSQSLYCRKTCTHPSHGLGWAGLGEKFALYGIDTLSETLTLGCLLACLLLCGPVRAVAREACTSKLP